MTCMRRTVVGAAAGLLVVGLQCAAGAAPAPLVAAEQRAHTAKPSAPIDLRHALQGEPTVGRPLTIELEITSRVAADDLRIEVAPNDDALALVSVTGPQFDASAGSRYTRRVVVVPRDDGHYYLTVIATLVRNGVPQSRAFSVPVRVGDAASAGAHARVETDASGRPLISLPAVETTTTP